jgi:hypothetical protein
MVAPVADAREVIDGYLAALTSHGDFARFFSDNVVATLEGTQPQYFRGREAVRAWIDSAHALGQVKIVETFACQNKVGGEFQFIRNDGVVVPYTVMYDIADEKITALRLFFTAPIG